MATVSFDRHGLQAERRGYSSKKRSCLSVLRGELRRASWGQGADVATKSVVSRELALGRTPGKGYHVMGTKTYTDISKGKPGLVLYHSVQIRPVLFFHHALQ